MSSCSQLAELEWFDQIVLRPCYPGQHRPCPGFADRGDHDDLPGRLGSATAATRSARFAVRQIDVEQDEVGPQIPAAVSASVPLARDGDHAESRHLLDEPGRWSRPP